MVTTGLRDIRAETALAMHIPHDVPHY